MDKNRLGTNTASLPNRPLRDALAEAKRIRFKTIELLTFAGARHSQGDLAGFWFDKLSEEERAALYEVTRHFEHIAVHLPFHDMPLFSLNEDVAEAAKRQLKIGLDAVGFLGGEEATMHLQPRAGYEFREYWSECVKTLRELGDYAAQYNVRLTVETMMPRSIDEFVGLLFDVDHDNVGANVDVGHLVGCSDINVPADQRNTDDARQTYNDTLLRLVDALGEKLYHVHLHDIRANDWRDHRAAGRGGIDFPRLFTKLKQIGYPHLPTFELEEPDDVPALRESKAFIEALM